MHKTDAMIWVTEHNVTWFVAEFWRSHWSKLGKLYWYSVLRANFVNHFDIIEKFVPPRLLNIFLTQFCNIITIIQGLCHGNIVFGISPLTEEDH